MRSEASQNPPIISCGEATIRLLRRYGIRKIFGIPGVHTLDFCRGLSDSDSDDTIQHIQARNELGAGFMAEGWARATGEVGVALVISGPGVTNAATAVAQCYCESLPMLLLSAEPPSNTIGKGWGVLHEVHEQKRLTEPITAFSATAYQPSDIPQYLAQAFTVFRSARPRPVHLSVPTDVQAMPVDDWDTPLWQPVRVPALPSAAIEQVNEAVAMMRAWHKPLIIVGGGATAAAAELTLVAETLNAPVISTAAGKGIIPESHPLCLGAVLSRPQAQKMIAEADGILAIATELSETDSFIPRLPIAAELIRIDLDVKKINDLYPAQLGIIADARNTLKAMMLALQAQTASQVQSAAKPAAEQRAKAARTALQAGLSQDEIRHQRLLSIAKQYAPVDTIWAGDACQLVYSGIFAMPVESPRKWFYPSGYCALGNALPNAIGAKSALPQTPVVALVGDGGLMFTVQELITAAQLKLNLPIIVWHNDGYKQIRDDMRTAGIKAVGVNGLNPDFVALAQACHCEGLIADSLETFITAFRAAWSATQPTVIVVRESSDWLQPEL